MEKTKIKKYVSLILCAVAMFMASTSTTMCTFWLFSEPEMPESLYKTDNN
jgi:cyclic lactone autoinducer peptide